MASAELAELAERISPHVAELTAIMNTESLAPALRHSAAQQLVSLAWVLEQIEELKQ